jgi:DNA-binding CsgD family transcriptional regulator
MAMERSPAGGGILLLELALSRKPKSFHGYRSVERDRRDARNGAPAGLIPRRRAVDSFMNCARVARFPSFLEVRMLASHQENCERDLFKSTVAKLTAATVELTDPEQVLLEFVDEMGFDFFSYSISAARNPNLKSGLIFTSYSSGWTERYRSRAYHNTDPVVVDGRRARLPFHWGSDRYISKLDEEPRNMMLEAKDFGIMQGFSVPIHGPDGESGLFSGARTKAAEDSDDVWSSSHHWMVALAPYVHAFGVSHLEQRPAGEPVVLTEHERTCLSWTLKGKTAWEISQIIGRSKPTVEYHLQKAIKKLDASNKAHAAALAMRKGLV